MVRVLLVDPDPAVLRRLAAPLLDLGYQVFAASRVNEAEEVSRSEAVDLVLLSLQLGPSAGLDLLERLKSWDPQLEAIILADAEGPRIAARAAKLGAVDVLPRSAVEEYVRVAVTGALRARSLNREVERLRSQVDAPLVGRLVEPSRAMQGVRELVRKAAQSDITVLITGESGVGKEIAARDLVAQSARAGAPLVTVDSGSLPETLVESELFGYEKGAFTGAASRKLGRLELADGGTIFLDEVGNLPLGLQPRLLRVLETCEVHRVGGTRPVRLDLRFVAATNADLEAMVRDGRFRDDLYHRLRVFPIPIPPLRERPEDIWPLFEHYLGVFNRKHRKQVAPPDDEVREALEQYRWPGNIRELANATERAVILAEDRIRLEQLSSLRVGPPAGAGPVADDGGELVPLLEAKEQASARAAATMIERALSRSRGDKKEAARLLGVSLKTLYNHLSSGKPES